MWKALIALAIVGGAVVFLLAGLRTTTDRPRFLRRIGLGLIAVSTFVGAVWIAAETFTDPGGWRGAGLVAMWLVPLVALSAIAWYRVAWATVLLGPLTAVVIALSTWFAIDPEAWRAFENDKGPIRAISTFVLAAPIAVLGLRRPLLAGVLLVVLGALPVAVSALVSAGGFGSLAAVSAPPVLAGILYVIGEAAAGRASTVPGVVPAAAAKR